jgi:molecular chaperone Hsp33
MVNDKMYIMSKNDLLHPFVFENTAVRGNVVHLHNTYQQAISHQNLPLVVKNALGELMAASALLTATLKMDGVMVIQIQTKGKLKLLVVECSANLEMRATAKWDGEISDNEDFLTLIQDGHCIITLDTKGNTPYQGIVPIEGDSVASMLENYILRSQQIDTKLWLSCDGNKVAGLLLQKLPETETQDSDAWNRFGTLANTITDNELLTLEAERIITNLFHEEDVRLFDPMALRFYCKCSREGVASMLQMLGKAEVDSIIAEQNQVKIHCDYCRKEYLFDAVDVATLFTESILAKASKAIH